MTQDHPSYKKKEGYCFSSLQHMEIIRIQIQHTKRGGMQYKHKEEKLKEGKNRKSTQQQIEVQQQWQEHRKRTCGQIGSK